MSTIKYILYARKSTEDEDKQVQSIKDQVDAMKDFAAKNKLDIVDIYTEEKSAKKPFVRPVFTQLIEDIRSSKANGILCWQLNRLSRNPTESGVLQQLLQDEEMLSIQTHDRCYLPSDNALIFSVEAGMSNQFIRDLMKNVRRGMHSKAEKGWLPGVPPIGYMNDRETKTIVIDPDRWLLVRKVWDLFLSERYTVSKLARIAEKELSLKTIQRRKKGGKSLSTAGMYAMLQNPFYAGWLTYGGKVYEGKHEQMVTQAEFDTAQQLINKRDRERPSTKIEVDPFPYRGLIHCGECNCLVTYSKKTRHYKNGNQQDFEYCYCTRRKKDYECSQVNTIKPEELTRMVRIELEKYTIMPEFFELAVKYLDQYYANESSKQQAIFESQSKAIDLTENEIRNLQRMLYQGRCDEDFFDKENQKLENRLLMQRKQFNEQESGNKSWRDATYKLFNFARYAKEDFESDDDTKKRQVLIDLSENLVLLDGKLVFQPIKYLVPVIESKQEMESRLLSVRTLPEQMKKASFEALIQDWYTRQDSNL
ncbi:recombinase family protein [Candidatus Saccharibacteria bacterium]|nr:recombinase family protein [Candidatus Saccharibacteria bacterium]